MSDQPKKVLIVGAGAAGMACADSLSKHPDKFKVIVIEAQGHCGGQAFSIPIDEKRFGVSWMNQGVQGGSYIYKHTFHQFGKRGFDCKHVDLQVSFGKDDRFWTNLFPTQLLEKHQSEIKRFKRAIKIIRWTEVFWALVPIKITLKVFGFSDDFMNFMIYPSLALFLGTGNATPNLPTVMMERLYTSPTYGMWYPIDEKSLSSNLPPMVVFPELKDVYGTWQKDLEKNGVTIRLNTEVTAIVDRSSKGVKVTTRPRREQPGGFNPNDADQDLPESLESFDEIVLCGLADTNKRLLGKKASWLEKFLLGKPTWSDDVTVTHTDSDYMKKYYTTEFDSSQAVSTLGGRDDSDRVQQGKKDFSPMYMINQTPSNPKLLEMCFDCSAFQFQLKEQNKPFEDHIFQTIFLNKKDEHTWTKDEIDKDKIIMESWWHQLCHKWQHYLFVVPFMWLIQGHKHTHYAAAWTLVNAHELAIISGMAAAYRLGASYPAELEQDKFALLCFKLYYFLEHMGIYKKGSRRS